MLFLNPWRKTHYIDRLHTVWHFQAFISASYEDFPLNANENVTFRIRIFCQTYKNNSNTNVSLMRGVFNTCWKILLTCWWDIWDTHIPMTFPTPPKFSPLGSKESACVSTSVAADFWCHVSAAVTLPLHSSPLSAAAFPTSPTAPTHLHASPCDLEHVSHRGWRTVLLEHMVVFESVNNLFSVGPPAAQLSSQVNRREIMFICARTRWIPLTDCVPPATGSHLFLPPPRLRVCVHYHQRQG